MNFSLPTLEATLSVLTAMVTPAVMILATSSLILTTTNRLVRVVDRVREMFIFESRLALASAYAEIDYIRHFSGHLAPPELRKRRGLAPAPLAGC